MELKLNSHNIKAEPSLLSVSLSLFSLFPLFLSWPALYQKEFPDLRERSRWPSKVLITRLKESFPSPRIKNLHGQYCSGVTWVEESQVWAHCNCGLHKALRLTGSHLAVTNSLKSLASLTKGQSRAPLTNQELGYKLITHLSAPVSVYKNLYSQLFREPEN